jgi:hypothetical protein
VYLDDPVPHRIQHQLGDGMKPQLAQDIASVRFCGCQCHIQDRGNVLGSLAFAHQLHDFSLA